MPSNFTFPIRVPRLVSGYIVFLMMMGLVGCDRREEFQEFAMAGIDHCERTDVVLVEASRAQINGSSWRMLSNDNLANVTGENYVARDAEDVETLQILSDIRAHNQALHGYFDMLHQLTILDTPQRGRAALENSLTGLSGIGEGVRGRPYFTEAQTSFLSSLGELVLEAQVESALRDHFETHGSLLRKEIATQELLLGLVGERLTADITDARSGMSSELAVQLTAPERIKDPFQWADRREAAFMGVFEATEVPQAQLAATNLRRRLEAIAGTKELK